MTEGQKMHDWARDLWPMNRSLTGPGVRETLDYIAHLLPGLEVHSVASGTRVHDWTIPQEWHCREAWIITPDGERICDFSSNNLHLVGYSTPIDATLTLDELDAHLHTLPDLPDAIPYVTSYYKERWGFCLSQRQRDALEDGDYQVHIDSELYDGVLNYADLLIPGRCSEEIFLSTYVCHPSMANNELSGPVLVAALGQWLLERKDELRYSYRLAFTPETIGAICYMQQHATELKRIVAGYQVTCVGDERCFSCITSPYADTVSDEVALETLGESAPDFVRYSYLDRGSDERQYCAPHIRLPIASICRSKYAEYPEYHSSADDLEHVVTAAGLQGSFDLYRSCIEKLEDRELSIADTTPRSERAGCPSVTCIGEPQLGKRGLYHELSHRSGYQAIRNIINIIAYCDGTNDRDQISQITGIDPATCDELIAALIEHRLVEFTGA